MNVEKARSAVRRFFARRQLADIRTVADISESGREQFLSAKLWPGGTFHSVHRTRRSDLARLLNTIVRG